MNDTIIVKCCEHCEQLTSLIQENANYKTFLWGDFVNAIPCLLGGILGLIALIYLLKYVVKPLIEHCHEKKLLNQKNENEKEWKNREFGDKRRAFLLKEMEHILMLETKVVDKLCSDLDPEIVDSVLYKLSERMEKLKAEYKELSNQDNQ